MNEFKNILEPERLPCMTKVWRPLIPNHKDRYLTPEELKLYVLQSPRILAIIDELSENDKNKSKKLQQSVRDMLNEIGLARSLPVIRWLGICLNKIFQRICTAVYVNEESLKRVKNIIGNRPVLYLPSHRSYADFVLMSYICFAYDLEIPGIAAGMDFHAMVGMGTILRKTGAFFMRRSFSTDKLYWYVFKEYMRALVNVYHIGIEFFIEGTRSRSCKALMPKIGLLSMALEPLFMGEVPDIIIVPVGVAYEKPLEEQLFAYELLGIPKPKESTMGFLKALQILDSNYGNMYVNFGQPISVMEYLGNNLNRHAHAQMPAHVQNLTKSELNLINQLAHKVISCQQNLIVISTFNVTSIYYNYRINMGKTTRLEELCDGTLLLTKILKSLGALVNIEKHNVKSKILDSLNTHSNILRLSINGQLELVKPIIVNLQNVDKRYLKGSDLSENTVRNAIPTFSLQLYSNPCLYWLARPAIIILAIRRLTHNGLLNTNIDKLKTEVKHLFNIFENEFVLNQCEWDNNFHSTLNFIINNDIASIINGNEISQNINEISNIYLSSIAPYLCCYYQVADIILLEFSKNNNHFMEKDLLVKVQQRIEDGLNEKKSFIHPYCLSLDCISLAIQSFFGMQLLNKHKSNNNSSTTYSVNGENLSMLKNTLEEYCYLLPFNYLSNYLMFAKL